MRTKILIVGYDNYHNIPTFLSLPYEIESHNYPETALRYIEKEEYRSKIGLVLTNFSFSGRHTTNYNEATTNGLSFLRDLKIKGYSKPSLMISSAASIQLHTKAQLFGAVGCLEHPVPPYFNTICEELIELQASPTLEKHIAISDIYLDFSVEFMKRKTTESR